MLHINKVWLSGVVRTHPRIRSLSEKTNVTSFTLSVLETWSSPSGETKSHRNDISVEVLGKEADGVFHKLKPGDWISIDGYLRSEQFKGRTVLSVRVYNLSYEGKDEEDKNRSTEDMAREIRFIKKY